jgi:hypothetical protein
MWFAAPTGGPPHELVRFDPLLHPPNRGSFRVTHGLLYFLGEARESDVWVMEMKRP